ncbi:hypothetical protein DFH09DRAFT_1451095, partial [Mycena vulgaris]
CTPSAQAPSSRGKCPFLIPRLERRLAHHTTSARPPRHSVPPRRRLPPFPPLGRCSRAPRPVPALRGASVWRVAILCPQHLHHRPTAPPILASSLILIPVSPCRRSPSTSRAPCPIPPPPALLLTNHLRSHCGPNSFHQDEQLIHPLFSPVLLPAGSATPIERLVLATGQPILAYPLYPPRSYSLT